MKLEAQKSDWADGEPSNSGNCAIADQSIGYNLHVTKYYVNIISNIDLGTSGKLCPVPVPMAPFAL